MKVLVPRAPLSCRARAPVRFVFLFTRYVTVRLSGEAQQPARALGAVRSGSEARERLLCSSLQTRALRVRECYEMLCFCGLLTWQSNPPPP